MHFHKATLTFFHNIKVAPDTHQGNSEMNHKYLLLLAIPAMLTLTSCHKDNDSDDNNTTTTDNRKIEKILVLYYSDNGDFTGGSINGDYTYQWDGDKLTKILNSAGWCQDFTYDGDKVSEVFWYSIDYQGTVHPGWTWKYTYTDNRVSSYIYTENSSVSTFQVFYNDNGEVSKITGNRSSYNDTYQYTWQNGNVSQRIRLLEPTTSNIRGYTNTISYTYDNHKALTSLIKGLDVTKYRNGLNPSSVNNVLTSNNHTVYDDGTESTEIVNRSRTYDGVYPITDVSSYSPSGSKYYSYYKYTNTSDPRPTLCKVTSPNPTGGTVKGTGTYASGKTVKLLATPSEGYHFTGWSNGSTSNPLTFTASGDVEYQASFEADE